MENENSTERLENPFKFLEYSDVQEKFADMNIELLRGRHIQKDSYYAYRLLNKYFNEIKNYYSTLYNLVLERMNIDNVTFYYLDFNEDSKGSISSQKRHKELTAKETVTGIMLLNMYYERYFDNVKEIGFEDIKTEVEEGENSISYRKLFFKEVRNGYSKKEWGRVTTALKTVLADFEQLGWIEKITPNQDDEIRFILKESIFRFQKLYEAEITNFDEFTESYLAQIDD